MKCIEYRRSWWLEMVEMVEMGGKLRGKDDAKTWSTRSYLSSDFHIATDRLGSEKVIPLNWSLQFKYYWNDQMTQLVNLGSMSLEVSCRPNEALWRVWLWVQMYFEESFGNLWWDSTVCETDLSPPWRAICGWETEERSGYGNGWGAPSCRLTKETGCNDAQMFAPLEAW